MQIVIDMFVCVCVSEYYQQKCISSDALHAVCIACNAFSYVVFNYLRNYGFKGILMCKMMNCKKS